ncbi:Cj0814 family flagellar-dependent secreted protein [Campylobacter sp. VTCC 70190]|uniref:Cj0814 family flagellar-dependent secreted protein n=1 Tax=Campylobacter sp. VTCC 70190 TaxID=3392118 RepID=UPI00398F45DF
MLNINLASANSFANFNVNIKNNFLNSNTSNNKAQNLQDTKENSKTNDKILGYSVDKDGYFTSDFNEAAGIPKDYKIHSSTMESLVRVSTNEKDPFRAFKSIDIAKTAGNAYKILSQVVGEDVLNSKDSFSLEELANFPQGYEFNRQSMQVTKIYNSKKDYLEGELSFDYKNTTDAIIDKLFFNTSNIFNNNNGGKENAYSSVFFDTTPSKYTNKDGTISKGGLLVAIINENIYTREGEATIMGKSEGFDKTMDAKEVAKAWHDANFNLKLDKNTIVEGAGIVNVNDENIEFTPLIELMRKNQKELIEYLNKRKKVDIIV